MNVAIDVSVMRACRTGTEEYTEGLVWGLSRLGTAVIPFGAPSADFDPERPCLGLLPRPAPTAWQKWWWETRGLLHPPAGADLLHIPYMTHPQRSLAIRTVVTVHDVIPYRLAAYRRRWRERAYFDHVRRCLPYATAVVAISHATRADIADFFPGLAEKVVVIPNGVHPLYYGQATETDEARAAGWGWVRSPRLLYAGGYDVRKNVATLIRAARGVFARMGDGQLLLVGAAGREDITRLAAEAGVADRVVMTGRLNRDELAALYRRADVFAFPSTYEGFGLPPAQALAAGTPVVAGRTPAVAEVLGDAAVLVNPTAVDEWEAAICQVLADSVRTREMVERGRMRAADFAWEAVARQYAAMYRSVAGQ